MKLMRAATLSVADLDRSVNLCTQWLDYSVAEQGKVTDNLAASWGCGNAPGRRQAFLRPASGHLLIRLVENTPNPRRTGISSC